MGQMSQEQINVDLFDEVKILKRENELLNAENELLQAKWEAQGLMIQKFHEENNLRIDKLIKKLRELHQINLYSVNEYWCIQLFDLDVCPNDYDVQPCREFECVYETSGKDLFNVLSEALEWAKEQFEI